MNCASCGKELLTVYKGVWVNDRTQIQPEFVCPAGCEQPDLMSR